MLRALRLVTPVLVLIDVSLVLAAFVVGDSLRRSLGLGVPLPERVGWLSGQICLAAAAAWAAGFLLVGAHQALRVVEAGSWRRLLFGHLAGLLFFLAALFFLKVYHFSRLLVTYSFGVGALLLLVRAGLSTWLMRRLSGRFARRVLVVGGGEVGEEVAHRLQTMPFGLTLSGVVAVDGALAGFPRLGAIDELSQIIERHRIDDVMIALPGDQHALVEDLIIHLAADPVRIHFVPDVIELTMIRATVSDFFGIPVVGLREPPIDEAGRLAKRIFDLVLGTLATVGAAPVMIACAALIKLYDGGPVFFRQKRIGENGMPFDMLKFRSMVVDAEQRLENLGVDFAKLSQDNPVFKIPNDPRITPVGRFLRRWSLDEVPQLLNVLKGDMSLVGPRPEEAGVVARYSYFHRKRLAVKPGITGPMQVSGRGDLPLKQRLSLELAYIEGWTLWSDLKILAKTVPVVLWGKGAY